MARYNGRRVLQVLRFGSIVKVDGQPVETFDADKKLDKQTGTTSYTQAYVKTNDGQQRMLDAASQANANSLVVRTNQAQILLPNQTTYVPTDEQAISKRYAEGHYSGVYKHDVTILLNRAGTGNEFYKIRGHVFNNSSTALTTLSGFFADLICGYGGDTSGNGYAVQKIPNGFAYDVFTNPRAAFTFTNSAGVITYIDPSDTSVISDVSVSDVVEKL